MKEHQTTRKAPQEHPSLPAGEGLKRHFLIALGVTFVLWMVVGPWLAPGPTELSYTQFKQAVRQDQVAEVTFERDHISGRFADPLPGTAAESDAQSADGAATAPLKSQDGALRVNAGEEWVTTMPQVQDPDLLPLLETRGVEIAAKPAESGMWTRVLATLLPWAILLGGFLYLSQRMQKRLMGGGQDGGLFSFGKAKAKRFRHQDSNLGMDDVAGLENAKADLQEIVDHLADPQRFRRIGATMPKGVLLIGPPGTGKTLLARAVAGEAGVPFFSLSGSEFVEMFVGVGASRVRDLFEAAKKEAPCVIFIDEIDAVGRSRGAGLGGGHDEREQTLNQILSEMDGFTPTEDIVVLAATNRPDVLDKALLRPGRFDRKVHIELPDRKARKAILDVHARKIRLAEDTDLGLIAARTVGFSGADLENLLNEAALLAGRERKEAVDMKLLESARDKIVLGAERDRGVGDDERRLVAYHESGHALMAWLLPAADQLDKISIVPRGQALGVTEQLPEEERRTYKESYLRDRIGVMLGGRVAEQTVFGEVTTGAESDLAQATELARRMVARWGMSRRIGPVAFRRGDEPVFLGREMGQSQDFSDATARLIDEEIRELVADIEARARRLMDEHRDRLERLAEAVLEEESLDRAAIDAILGEPPKVGEIRRIAGVGR
ncbi:ATP-dependent zinc metalloprotease FtsH [Allochromatium palmeri]|uniref:ATP-dependent zinc metalloprotease FtsH n=1 Tax=Allochromatium palmeri TaxID=231048 RepID=A0A6N8E9V3_9GAMM|nr:ATP-dependent zinc metalloprotease FtsH [Allochromatium palmeri]MTW21072.1 ATP-dependent zinc metalloprotease FtsH [Allochromatium palmeri]